MDFVEKKLLKTRWKTIVRAIFVQLNILLNMNRFGSLPSFEQRLEYYSSLLLLYLGQLEQIFTTQRKFEIWKIQLGFLDLFFNFFLMSKKKFFIRSPRKFATVTRIDNSQIQFETCLIFLFPLYLVYDKNYKCVKLLQNKDTKKDMPFEIASKRYSFFFLERFVYLESLFTRLVKLINLRINIVDMKTFSL